MYSQQLKAGDVRGAVTSLRDSMNANGRAYSSDAHTHLSNLLALVQALMATGDMHGATQAVTKGTHTRTLTLVYCYVASSLTPLCHDPQGWQRQSHG